MQAPELRPLRIGELLDAAIKIYLKHALTLFKAVFVVVAPLQVLILAIQASALPDSLGSQGFSSNGFGQPSPTITPEQLWTVLAANLAIVILAIVGGLLASAACLKAVSDAYLGHEPSWRGSLSFAASSLRSLLWVLFLAFLGLALGFVVCVIPGIYLYVAWSVAVPAVLIERRRGSKALGRSRDLVRERWWPVCGALVVGYLLASFVQVVLGGLFFGVLVSGAGQTDWVRLVTSGLVGTAGRVLTTPFTAAVTTLIYFDLRVRKEGFDLQLLAERMGVELPEGAVPPSLSPPAPGDGSEPPFWPPPPGWTPGPPAGGSGASST
jgi:hypothetical protein